MSAAVKPVHLQVNSSGAWRDVVSFDAADDTECAEVLAAAATLGKISRATFRVVKKDPPLQPSVLMHWKLDTGWEEHKWPLR